MLEQVENRQMKMKELEQLSGVSRETIRFYIREGLLPEPERPKRNVALYNQEHVERLALIRQLQTERFLPLSVIRSIFHGGGKLPADSLKTFSGLGDTVHQLLEDHAGEPDQPVAGLVAKLGIDQQAVDNLKATGFLKFIHKDGEDWVDRPGRRMLELLAEAAEAGFTPDSGYAGDNWQLYADFVDWLAREEVGKFYRNVAERLGPEDAARMAARGIRIINEMLSLMHTSALFRVIAEMSSDDRGE